MSDIIFGTDGWRGRIAEDYTFDSVRRCTQGFADYLKATYDGELARGVVIGGDKRFLSEQFAAAAAEVLAGNGIPVHFCGGGVPTPVISFGATERHAIGAINITASHNPPGDNGFKVRDPNGGAIDPDGLKAIEARIPDDVAAVKRVAFDAAVKSGLIQHYDPLPAYDARIRSLVDVEAIKAAGFTVLVDNMWGNGAGYISRFISGDATRVIEYHAERNPLFPEMKRPEPIPPNVDAGLARGREVGADAVCIMDGDADRCGFGDEHGEFIDQLRVYGLLAMYLLAVRGERGPIIKTLSTTSMLDKLGARYGVPVIHTGVGFKYVAPAMMEHDGLIGGEESGGYAFRGHVPERDGILANLYLLDLMRRTGKKPTELLVMLFDLVGGPHYYDRIDTRLKDNAMKQAAQTRLDTIRPATIAGLQVTDKVTTDGYKFVMEDGGWLLIRFSGTEPLIRVYCETMHADKVQAILQDGLKVAGIA
ncbi:MAG: phosphomannomutase [Anaerolineae bacterium CG2_30_64_16]|nr:MAG: phosphomannomutase [Anaerolineae bacterium CG2_30_64_16]